MTLAPYVEPRADLGPTRPSANGHGGPGEGEGGDSVSVLGLLATLVERWKFIAAGSLLGAALAAAVGLSQPRTYTAHMELVTVSASKGPSLGGVLGSGLLNLGGSGIQATPAFVIHLMETDAILREVALTPLSRAPAPLVSRLALDGRPPRREQYARLVARTVRTSVDRDAGTITLEATHPDSAIARLIAQRLLDETSRGFLRASRAQAVQQRAAQDRRVEVAGQQLRAAEAALLEFTRANRVLESYAGAYLDRQRLERTLSLAQNVYAQAVGDRESAVAKELEDTPALVVLDPIPDTFAPNPRHTGAKIVAAAFTGALLASLWVLVRSLVLGGGAADVDRLRGAARTVPVVRRFVRA